MFMREAAKVPRVIITNRILRNITLSWLTVGIKTGRPYGEVGNVGVNDRNDRQTRFRVGVAYTF